MSAFANENPRDSEAKRGGASPEDADWHSPFTSVSPLVFHVPVELDAVKGSKLKWGCIMCGSRATTREKLLNPRRSCKGLPAAASDAHDSHRLFVVGHYFLDYLLLLT